jgi:sterol desaturase/sphingolipid hydroxylase (fatty acid hydroxylase superfamily)
MPDTLPADFTTIWALAFAASVAVFLAAGVTLEAVNRRHPERRIQPRAPSSARRRDMLASIRQLAVTCTCLALGMALQRAGWGVGPLAATWWSVPLMAGLGIVLLDAWFYAVHRLLHTRALWRFHRPHHRNVTPTVWSNDSGHAVDTALTHGFYVLLPLLLPVPLVAVVIVRLFDQITAIIGHAGFEHFAGATMRWPWPGICTLYHDQHHSAFRYNYANFFSVWDRVFGTIHPRYDAEVAAWEAHYTAARIEQA